MSSLITAVTGAVGGMVGAVRQAREIRWRRPPPLKVEAGTGRPPTVYYLTPHLSSPSGGVRTTYRHVDLLNGAGVAAAVLHARKGFRCSWFANETRVVAAAEVVLGARDVLVVPECYGPGLRRLPRGPRVVVFNQGAYHTFDHIAYDTTRRGAPYAGLDGLVALLAVSQNNVDLLRHTFPDVPVHRARAVVDDEIFHPAKAPAGRRIAYLTHRRAQEREQLLHILRARGVTDGWELVPIAGRSERETGELMRGCALFLSFSEREGFGLPPAEAMASGCYVVGHDGLGGREFFDPAYCAPVPDGDLLGFATAVEESVAAYDTDAVAFAKRGLTASDQVLGRYSRAGLRVDLLSFYRPLLDG